MYDFKLKEMQQKKQIFQTRSRHFRIATNSQNLDTDLNFPRKLANQSSPR